MDYFKAIGELLKIRGLSHGQFFTDAGIDNSDLAELTVGKEISPELTKKIATTLEIPPLVLYIKALEVADLKKDSVELYQQLKPVLDGLADLITGIEKRLVIQEEKVININDVNHETSTDQST